MTTIARAWEAFLQAIEEAKALHAAGRDGLAQMRDHLAIVEGNLVTKH